MIIWKKKRISLGALTMNKHTNATLFISLRYEQNYMIHVTYVENMFKAKAKCFDNE